MDDLTKLLLPIIISSILAVIAAIITTHYKFKKQLDSEREKENKHIRLKILNPLLIAAEDLLSKIIDIKRRRKNPLVSKQMQQWFLLIKNRPWHDEKAFASWANDEGYFAMSSIYITTLYFFYASKIRRDFPFIGFTSGGETELLSHISEVRTAIGGKYGIWEVMQDSLGVYVETESGAIKNYRQFCESIIDDNEHVWFNRLIDFYRDIHLKRDDHLDNIQHALNKLIKFLNENLSVKRITYKITEELLKELDSQEVANDIPKISKDKLEKLGQLIQHDYMNEVDFIDHIVSRIGQDLADDYKPTILKRADKKYV